MFAYLTPSQIKLAKEAGQELGVHYMPYRPVPATMECKWKRLSLQCERCIVCGLMYDPVKELQPDCAKSA